MSKKRYYLIPIIICCVLLVIGSFLDFQINSAIYSPKCPFGTFMAACGEYPGYCFMAFLGSYIMGNCLKNVKSVVAKVFLYILGAIAIGCAVYFQGKAITSVNGYNIPDKKWIVGIPISIAILAPIVIFGVIFGKKCNSQKAWLIALIILISLAVSIGIITLVKAIPHRPRYRWLIAQDEVSFHNWWERFGEYKNYIIGSTTSEEFKSFPSGHTGTVAILIDLPFLTFLFNRKVNKQKLLYFLGVSYVALLAFTRMLCGAHFLTDVSMGALISFIVHAISAQIITKVIPETKQ